MAHRFNLFDFISWRTFTRIRELPEPDRSAVLAHEILRVLRNELFLEKKLDESTFIHNAMIHVRGKMSWSVYKNWGC